jgi:hypothetical protein
MAEPRDAHPLSRLQIAVRRLLDHPDDLVPGHDGIAAVDDVPVHNVEIGAADAAGVHGQ